MKRFLLLCIIFASTCYQAAWGQVAIIAHKSVPVTSITADKVADIYRLKTRKWENGKKIVLYNLKQKETIKEQFYQFIRENPLNIKKLWMRLQLTGEAVPPEALESEEAVLEKVASTPGAIGFISKEKVSDDVRIIAVVE